jgi:hypothetical protein
VNNADVRRVLAQAYLTAARAWSLQGEAARARASREHAHHTLADIALRWNEGRLQAVYALTLLELGRRAEAGQIAAKLERSGYRNRSHAQLWQLLTPTAESTATIR